MVFIIIQVWNKRDGDGRACSDSFDFTPINSQERLKLLRGLPPCIPDLVGGETKEAFRQVFEVSV